ncbi:WD repeat-containing and planar cell polarity effector protein fritz homolog isoform X2 [Conger conger]|uniref:WD repeat-containing and planar cell polarity effector protein fritz homolog isoform X2 n=1 Tax=Conger conger TaxID=82655 RepID=UPI002A5A42A8|nr:WD repeat-containing and planar cell polarity effector protein fritz homolog isoform X2 [Conger conger]
MSFCLAELHLWSSKSALHVSDTDIGTYQYYDKGEPVNPTDHHYFTEKQHFTETRGLSWTPRNSRPEKLRDSLKELEELLQVSPCVGCRWRNTRSCQMLLSSGVLVTLGLSGAQLERVCVDRALAGRLGADTISDAVITDRFLLLSFVEKNKVCLVHLPKKTQGSPDLSRRADKLSFSELKISSVDLPGPAGRRLGRRVVLNRLQDMGVCWWPAVNEESWPWSPVPSEGDRANLVLLGCGGPGGLKVLSRIRTEGDPLDCRFSLAQPYQILTVELGAGESSADSCVYECARGRPQRLSVTSVPLSSRPAACCRDPWESRLLLGLRDSSLLLYDPQRGVTLLAQVPMLPSCLAWHPAGGLLLVGDGQGELQCFDAGLSPLRMQLLAEDPAPGPTLQLSRHLRAPGGLAGLQWAAPPPGAEGSEVSDLLFLHYHGGPVGALRFRLGALSGGQLGPGELLQDRLRCGQAEEALGLLGAMDWSIMGAECYRALAAIADHLLRQELVEEREAQLEATLGTFYAPSQPLSDTVVLEYRDPISKYARRFFHHLLRYQRFEKAFLLAVDIGARDLFMDIHYVAGDKGELVLAEVAKRKANEIDAESLTTGPGEQEWSSTCDSSAPDRLTDRRSDAQPGRRSQGLAEGSGRTSYRGQSQDSLGSRAAGRGKQTRRLDGVFPGVVPGVDTWDWAQAEFNLDASEDQVTGETGTLKVVHFGLV